MGAMGIADPDHLHPWHIMRRSSPTEIKHYGERYEFLGERYEFLKDGDLLKENLATSYERACRAASADTFEHTTA